MSHKRILNKIWMFFRERLWTALNYRIIVTMITMLVWSAAVFAQTDVFEKEVSLPRQYSSIYSVLNQISNETGYYFVYDTEILNSDQKIRLRSGDKTLNEWLDEIIDDPLIGFNIIENHILIYRPAGNAGENDDQEISGKDSAEEFFVIQGRVIAESSRNPLPYATVGIQDKAVGITTNSDGVFTLKLSGEYVNDHISVSHLGYLTRFIPVKLFKDNKVDILMETDYISIQEVMIRYYDPDIIVNAAMERISDNYSDDPVYLLNFYREGVMRTNKFINYSEALFHVYKSPYNSTFERDQVKLLQSRTISNVDRSDTLILKIKAGVRNSLELDFIRNIPDFLNKEYMQEYDFTKADIVSKDGKRAYAVAFEQKKHIKDPLFKGLLYIDMESFAFLGADFEVHPDHVDKASNHFVTRKNRNYKASVDKAIYTVSYKYYDGSYHLNHVRADLHLRYRKRYRIFSNSYHVFVEMATSRIGTEDVSRFNKKEELQTGRVFIDGNHEYDPDFWSNYSIIAPEKHITQALSLIDSKIESVVSEEGSTDNSEK